MDKLDLKDYLIMVLDAIAELPPVIQEGSTIPDLIPKKVVLDILKDKKIFIDGHNESLPKTYTKIMYVEDGSVDVAELESELPDTKIIVYRQGARPPELKDIQSNPIKGY